MGRTGMAIPERATATVVNDVHSQLNATRVDAIVKPDTLDDIRTCIADARSAGKSVSIAGGRHAMGGDDVFQSTWYRHYRTMFGSA